MTAPVILMRCKCGKVWDTHGRYLTCPFCASSISESQRVAGALDSDAQAAVSPDGTGIGGPVSFGGVA